jgi:protein SCO1
MSNKQNYSYVGIAFIILIFGILVIPKIVSRFQEGDVTRLNESRSNNQNKNILKKTANKLPFLIINGEKKKVSSFSFLNQDNNLVSNLDYLGKVYVVEFFFTTCPSICPKMNRNLVDIQNEFQDLKNFGIVSLTINPDYDTVEVLKDYANNYGVTNPNWNFLTGNKKDILNLANIGFNIYAEENPNVEGGFEHSGNFALVDKKGFLRSRNDKYGNPIIFYKGIVSESQGEDVNGVKEEISILKQDILNLLENE